MTRKPRTIVLGALLWLAGAVTAQAAPQFVQITVTFVRVSDGQAVGQVVVPAAGYTNMGVAGDRRVVIKATVGNNPGGVSSIALTGESTVDCQTPGEATAQRQSGTLAAICDEVKAGTSAPGSPALRNATFTVDPLDNRPDRRACGCARNILAPFTNDIVLVAQGGNGTSLRSPRIRIGYVSTPPTCAIAGGICGDKARGQIRSCPNNGLCDFRRSQSCSGFWIFRQCQTIVSIDMFCPL